MLRSICVFAGSNAGGRGDYADAARELADELAARGIGLVYGGAKVGLMGMLADRVLGSGGRVTGVIPEFLVQKEVAHSGLSELLVVPSMHARKARMAELADGFIALPGGFGTIEEVFEVLTWAQLAMHEKPCGLLNVCGYYAGLLDFLNHATSERFLKPAHRSIVLVADRAAPLLDEFARYRAPRISKWMDAAKP
jgi:uncharacterized protein (TIGR00730 family)